MSARDQALARREGPTCAICGNLAARVSPLVASSGEGYRTAWQVECRLCGIYDVTHMAASSLDQQGTYSAEERNRLSAATRTASDAGTVLELSSGNIAKLIESAPQPGPIEQMDLILRHIAKNTGPQRQPVRLTPDLDRHVAHTDGKGLLFALRALRDRGLIERDETVDIPHFVLTTTGYERVRELEGADQSKALVTPSPAELDPVTRTLNRAAFDRDTPQAVGTATSSTPVSLVMVDVDHFKVVNDSHGHPKGDEVLRGIGQRLTAVALGKGKVYRYGGEEFVMILPNHGTEEAAAVAERARRAIESEPIAEIPVTASFGVTTAPDHAKDPAALVKAADELLYLAKRSGRNRVCSGQSPSAGSRVARTLDELTPDEREELRREKLRGGEPKCPADGGILKLTRVTHLQSPGEEFIARCPICNKQARLSPPIEFEIETIDESGVRTKRTEKG